MVERTTLEAIANRDAAWLEREAGSHPRRKAIMADLDRNTLVGWLDAFKADPFSHGRDKVESLVKAIALASPPTAADLDKDEDDTGPTPFSRRMVEHAFSILDKDAEIARLREALTEAVSFIEHMSECTGYPGDDLAREEYDDKIARFAALNQGKD